MTISTVSVADEMAFEALPDDVKELARRVLGTRVDESELTAVQAYRRGFKDGVDRALVERPIVPSTDAIIDRLCEPY